MTETKKENKVQEVEKVEEKKKGSLMKVVVVVLLIGGWLGTAYFFKQNRTLSVELSEITSDPNLVAQKEVKKLVEKVSELVVLPKDETPVVATVEDKEKLAGQVFFENAENGDKVLIYARSRKVYLYDPEGHKVLEVAPLNIGTAGIEEVEARIVLANGTETVGATANAEEAVLNLMPKAEIVDKINAARSDYEGVKVIDVTGENRLLVFQMAQALGVEAAEMPEGESVEVEADILIIVGK